MATWMKIALAAAIAIAVIPLPVLVGLTRAAVIAGIWIAIGYGIYRLFAAGLTIRRRGIPGGLKRPVMVPVCGITAIRPSTG